MFTDVTSKNTNFIYKCQHNYVLSPNSVNYLDVKF